MAESEDSYSRIGNALARSRGDSAYGRFAGVARWHLAAARGEIQRAAAVTSATWERARRAVVGLLYDSQAQGHASGQRHHR